MLIRNMLRIYLPPFPLHVVPPNIDSVFFTEIREMLGHLVHDDSISHCIRKGFENASINSAISPCMDDVRKFLLASIQLRALNHPALVEISLHMFQYLWTRQIQLLPVVLALVITELPGLIRRFKKLYYVPVYFSVFPFRELNRDLSKYYGEDWPGAETTSWSKQQLEEFRKKIIFISTVSLAISVILTPAAAGFFSAFFLPVKSFAGFIILFIAYKLIGLVQSAITFSEMAPATRANLMWYCIIYAVYFGCFTTVFELSYDWATPFASTGQYAELWKQLRLLIFGQIFACGFIVALVASAATAFITDRKLRQQLRNDHR